MAVELERVAQPRLRLALGRRNSPDRAEGICIGGRELTPPIQVDLATRGKVAVVQRSPGTLVSQMGGVGIESSPSSEVGDEVGVRDEIEGRGIWDEMDTECLEMGHGELGRPDNGLEQGGQVLAGLRRSPRAGTLLSDHGAALRKVDGGGRGNILGRAGRRRSRD